MHSQLETASTAAASPWLRTLVANIQDAIVVLDGTGKVVFESPSAPGLLGVSSEGHIGTFGIERVHPDERDVVIRSFERTIAQPGAVARATYRFRGTDGEWRHLEAVAKNLLHDPELHGVLITLRDVTERMRALEAAEQAGHARDEFLSRMSHELRTPLHAILGWTQLLEVRDEPGIQEAAEQIAAAGHHLLRLVDEALDVAAVREGRISLDPRPLDVGAVVGDALDLMKPLAVRRDIQIRSEAGPAGLHVHADPGRLLQILINLLSNAVKYSRYAGEVVIAWGADETGSIRISVRDSGPGLDAAKLDHLFERFERLGMECAGIEGSGLGLAISRRLIQMMNGTIGVESRPGEGAEFWLRLAPAHPPFVNAPGPRVSG
jgi:PAS domain S-box-containing protein